MSLKRKSSQNDTGRDLSFDLKERVKELECLYGISQVLDRLNTGRDSAYVEVVNLVQSAFQYPQHTGVELTIHSNTYRSENFRAAGPRLTSRIRIGNENLGSLEVRFLTKETGKPAFLKEERTLVKAIAARLVTTAVRLRMGVQLENSEKFYRSLFENAAEGIFLHYADGHIVMANRAMSRISGHTLRELLRLRVGGLLSYDDAETSARSVGQTSRKSVARAAKLFTKVGHTKYVEITESQLSNSEEAIVTQTMIRDVSLERQRTESIHAYAGRVITAQENERKRIARELHDDTIQALLSLGMDIDAVLKMEKALPAQRGSRPSRGTPRDRTKEIGDSVKSLTRALRPPMLDEVGLLTALRWLASESVKGRAIESHFTIDGEARRLSGRGRGKHLQDRTRSTEQCGEALGGVAGKGESSFRRQQHPPHDLRQWPWF